MRLPNSPGLTKENPNQEIQEEDSVKSAPFQERIGGFSGIRRIEKQSSLVSEKIEPRPGIGSKFSQGTVLQRLRLPNKQAQNLRCSFLIFNFRLITIFCNVLVYFGNVLIQFNLELAVIFPV